MSEAIKESKRGFSMMSPDRRREIASLGGKKAHANGTAHKYTSAEAKLAGAKGGRTLAADREYMSRIGKRGGVASGVARRKAKVVVL